MKLKLKTKVRFWVSHLCPNLLDMCSKLPGTSTFALPAVLGPVWPHTLNTFHTVKNEEFLELLELAIYSLVIVTNSCGEFK